MLFNLLEPRFWSAPWRLSFRHRRKCFSLLSVIFYDSLQYLQSLIDTLLFLWLSHLFYVYSMLLFTRYFTCSGSSEYTRFSNRRIFQYVFTGTHSNGQLIVLIKAYFLLSYFCERILVAIHSIIARALFDCIFRHRTFSIYIIGGQWQERGAENRLRLEINLVWKINLCIHLLRLCCISSN